MRIVVSSSGLFVTFTIIVIIHMSIINKNIRDMEVNYGLQSAMDYALDVMSDEYLKMYNINDFEYREQQCIDKIMHIFCSKLEQIIGTDGEINVIVVNADVKTGNFEIVVEEKYNYAFKGRAGSAICVRAVRLG